MHTASTEAQDPESMFRVVTVPASNDLAVRGSRQFLSDFDLDFILDTFWTVSAIFKN